MGPVLKLIAESGIRIRLDIPAIVARVMTEAGIRSDDAFALLE